MCSCRTVLILVVVSCSVRASPKKYVHNDKNNGRSVLDKVVKDCLESKTRFSCFSEKAAVALERSMNWDIPISEGINLVRNKDVISPRTPKSLTGFKRLTTALSNFLDAHTISIDLTKNLEGKEGRALDDAEDDNQSGRRGGGGGGGEGGGGGGGLFNMNRQGMRRNRKYYRYAFMMLLGIFGLTGPLVLKVLGVMAAHALLASKAALMIVGSVALKKFFERDHQPPTVKVHTIPIHESEEYEYDRVGNSFANYKYIPYRAYTSYSSPVNHPYSAYSDSEDFAPIFYGTQKKSR